MNRYTTVTVPNMKLIRSTENAGLYQDEDGDKFWLPWSQVRDGSIDKDGQTGDVLIPLWLADEKGLGYEYEDDE